MSPREQAERVQRAIAAERLPLSGTLERFAATVHGRAGRLLLAGLIVGGGGLGAKEAGIIDAVVGHLAGVKAEAAAPAADPRVPALAAAVEANAKDTRSVKRLVRWLVNQEIRRQAREGGGAVEPPEDVE